MDIYVCQYLPCSLGSQRQHAWFPEQCCLGCVCCRGLWGNNPKAVMAAPAAKHAGSVCLGACSESHTCRKQAGNMSLAACMQILEPWHFDDKPEEFGPCLKFREHSFLTHPEVQAAIRVRPPPLTYQLQSCWHAVTCSDLAAVQQAGLPNQHWHGATHRWSVHSGASARAADGHRSSGGFETSCWRQAAALQQCVGCLSRLH